MWLDTFFPMFVVIIKGKPLLLHTKIALVTDYITTDTRAANKALVNSFISCHP